MASKGPKQPPMTGIPPVNPKNSHVIRVKVLGLAGVTVDRMKCRDKAMHNSAPPHPGQMKSIVAFSRNSVIKGMTTLSKPLTRSPSDEIVNGEGPKYQDDETATHTTRTSDRPQRHVAVWASDTGSIGSVVTFEANLHEVGKHQFAPISFDLTIAMVEDDEKEHQVGLPIGVATLAVSGNECENGISVQLDLPVRNLGAVKRVENKPDSRKGGFSGYPMIAISPRPKGLPAQRTALQRLFRRQNKPKVPSEVVRHAFASAYSVDASGDAILRVSLQIYEKGSATEKALHLRGDSSITSTFDASLSQSIVKAHSLNHNDSPTVEDDSKFSLDQCIESANSEDDTYDNTYDETFDDLYEGDDEDHSEGSGTYATNEDKLGFFAWGNAEVKNDDEDEYTLSFEKKVDTKAMPATDADDTGPIEIDFFGRKIQLPSCTSLPTMNTRQGENDSLLSRETKGRLSQLVNDFKDDITHVTADFFGRSYEIPVCSAVKGLDEYEDEDETLFTEGNTFGATDLEHEKNFLWTDKVCRYPHKKSVHLDEQGVKDTNFEQMTNQGLRQHMAAKLRTEKQNALIFSPDSAKEWLLTSKMPLNQEKATQGVTDSSPRRIHDFPPNAKVLTPPRTFPKKTNAFGKSISDFFGISQAQGEREAPAVHDFVPTEVPPVISPSDNASVGDLTANTHEMKIESESSLLDRYRKKYDDEQLRKSGGSRLLISVPFTFGGDGMCLGSEGAAPPSSPTRVESVEASSSIDDKKRMNENYFAEYDDYSIAAPLTVANQGRDPPPCDDDRNDTTIAATPIEMTISGFHKP